MTREEYESKYGLTKPKTGTIKSGGTAAEKLRAMLGVVEETPVTQQELVQSTRELYSGANRFSTPSMYTPVENVSRPSVQPQVKNMSVEQRPDQNASSLDYAKYNETVLPSQGNQPKEDTGVMGTIGRGLKYAQGLANTFNPAAQISGQVTDLLGSKPLFEKSPIVEYGNKKVEEALNSEPVRKATSKFYQLSSLSSYVPWLESKQDDTPLVQGAKGLVQATADIGATAAVSYIAAVTRKPQLLRIIPAYWSAKSAGGQVAEGKQISAEKVGVDALLDSTIGSFYEELLKKPGEVATKKLSSEIYRSIINSPLYKSLSSKTGKDVALGFGGESLTEVTQSIASNLIDIKNAKTPEERSIAMKNAVDYIKNGDMVMDFLVGGAASILPTVGISLASKRAQTKRDAIDEQKRIVKERLYPNTPIALPQGTQNVPLLEQGPVSRFSDFQQQNVENRPIEASVIPMRSGTVSTGLPTIGLPQTTEDLRLATDRRNSSIEDSRRRAEMFRNNEVLPAVNAKSIDGITKRNVVEPGDLTTLVNLKNEINKKKTAIVDKLVGAGETKSVAVKIVDNAVKEIVTPDIVSNGITAAELAGINLGKIVDTGLIKTVNTERPSTVTKPITTSPVVKTEIVNGNKVYSVNNGGEIIPATSLNHAIEIQNRIRAENKKEVAVASKPVEMIAVRKETKPTEQVGRNVEVVQKKETNIIKTKEQLDEEEGVTRSKYNKNKLDELRNKRSEKRPGVVTATEISTTKTEEQKSTVEQASSMYETWEKEMLKDSPNFDRQDKLAREYEELTGRPIEGHLEQEPTALNTSSKDRTVLEDNFDLNKILDELEKESGRVNFRKIKGKLGVGSQKIVEASDVRRGIEKNIEDINSGKTNFSLAAEAVRIAKKYGVNFMQSIPGSEGHHVRGFIGVNTLNNPFTLAHEMTHSLMLKNKMVLKRLLDNVEVYDELKRVYARYYPGGAGNYNNVGSTIIIHEGFAEFVSQSLYNPTQMAIEFPMLNTFLTSGFSMERSGDAKEMNRIVSSLYQDVNNLIYTYQHLTPNKQAGAFQVDEVNIKKSTNGSMLLGFIGNKITNYLNSRHIFKEIDSTWGVNHDKNKNFISDRNGISLFRRSSTFRKSLNIANSTFKEGADGTYILSKDGETIERRLPFGIGDYIRGVSHNKEYLKDFGTYLSALDSQRDRDYLQSKIDRVEELQDEIQFVDTKTSKEKIQRTIDATKEDIKRLQEITSSLPTSDELEKTIIKEGKDKFESNRDKFEQITNFLTDLQVESGALTQKEADESKARKGYSPQLKYMVDEMEKYNVSGKRSATTSTSRERGGSEKPVINPVLSLSQVFMENIKKYNAQLFYNDLYQKGLERGMIVELGEGVTNEPGTYIAKTVQTNKDGKEVQKNIRFKVLDPTLVRSIEHDFGMTQIKNPAWRAFHDYVLRKPARFSQTMTTALSPYFTFGKNIFIDIPTSYVLSKTGYVPGISQLQRVLGTGIYKGRSEEVKKYLEEFNKFHNPEIELTELGYDGVNPFGVAEELLRKEKWYGSAYGKFVKAMGVTETIVRGEEYVRSRLMGDGVSEASQKADNVSLNYQESGSRMRAANQAVMFLNSSTRAMYQTLGALKDKSTSKRLAIAIFGISALQIAAIAKMIQDVKDSVDDEEREDNIQKIYEYLDKSAYEKNSFIPLSGGYKLPTNSFMSWPGTLIGHYMIASELGIDTDKRSIMYGGLTSIVPGQILPDFTSQNVEKSIYGKLIGSTVVGNLVSNLTGFKTFPDFREIDTESVKYKDTNERFFDSTNKLAILLSQLTTWTNDEGEKKSLGISPLEFEAALRTTSGSMGSTLGDVIGDIGLTDEQKLSLNIPEGDYTDLLIQKPLKSAFFQSDRTLQGELVTPLYEKRNELESKKKSLVAEYNALLRSKGVTNIKSINEAGNSWLRRSAGSDSDYNRLKDLVKKKDETDKLFTDLEKKTDAIRVAKKYDKELPTSYINSLYRYANSIRTGVKTDKTDLKRIEELSTEAKNLGDGSPKTKWRYK